MRPAPLPRGWKRERERGRRERREETIWTLLNFNAVKAQREREREAARVYPARG